MGAFDAYQKAAVAAQEAGDYEAAIPNYLLALQRAPDHFGLLFNVSMCFYNLQKWSESSTFHRKYLAFRPDDYEALYRLSVCELKLGNPTEALTILLHVAAHDYRKPYVLNNISLLVGELCPDLIDSAAGSVIDLDDVSARLGLWSFQSSKTHHDLREFFKERPVATPNVRARAAADMFHIEYYDSLCWTKTFWRGIPLLKCPLDLWIYQELIHSIKPDLIIETGTFNGGSALYLANMQDYNDVGRVISVDISDRPRRPVHPRITYLNGSSLDDGVVACIEEAASGCERVMVILDSNHTADHVFDEMNVYSKLVTVGSYMIVEDTNLGGNPVWPEHGPGPKDAVEEFIKTAPNYVIDENCHKFMMSFNYRGYLKKIAR